MKNKVSIGMPVHNGELYVEASIESILAQTYQDFELIISDNASSDRSAEICTRLASRDGRIRFVRQATNRGAAANFNHVFRLSNSDYFKWACADDLANPTLVERAVAVLESQPDVVLCSPRTVLVDALGGVQQIYSDDLDLQSADVLERFQYACGHTGMLNVLQGMMRSSALSMTPLFRPFRGTDIALMVELTLHGKFVELPEPLLTRRMHREAASASETIEQRQEHLDPKSRGDLSTWWWRHDLEHARAVWRAPLSTSTKTRLYADIARQCYWQRGRLAQEAWAAARHWFASGRSRR